MSRQQSDLFLPDAPPQILPAHIEETVRAIAALHADHRRAATPVERVMYRLTVLVAQPRFLAALTLAIIAWMAANVAMLKLGFTPLDPPPFPWMDGAASVSALYMTAVILATQRREDQLSNLREQLTLELAILSEQKTAKTIELLEELRRDSPNLRDRVDAEADAMSRPADPQSVMEAIRGAGAESELQDDVAQSEASDA